MTKTMCAVLTACLSLAAAAQDAALTKEDVIKMVKAGIGEDVILAKIDQDKASFSLSAEDLAILKELKAGDKLLQRLTGGAAKPEAAAVPAGGANVVIKNTSHRAVKVSIDEKEKIVDFSISKGTDLAMGGTVELSAKAGEYKVAIEGRATTEQVRIPEEKSCLLTVKGADTAYIDVQTVVVEDADGRRVVILHSQGKVTEGQLRRADSGHRGRRLDVLWGPQMSHLPYVSNSVLLGAGIGAIIGHQSGHRTRGAVIGAAAGLLFDSFYWR